MTTALWPYILVFFSLCAAGIGIPLPEELPIVGAGLMAGQASEPHVYWWIMLPVCILGVVVCDGMLYAFGRFCGPRLLELRWVQKFIPRERRLTIEDNFHRNGLWVSLGARLLPTIRTPIFVMAGVMRLPFSKFLIADGIYAIPGVNLLFWLAYVFGNQFEDLIKSFEGKVAAARPLIILLAIVGVCIYLFYHFMRHPVATGDLVQEIPVIGEQVTAKIQHTDESASKSQGGQANTHENKQATYPASTNGQDDKSQPQHASKNA